MEQKEEDKSEEEEKAFCDVLGLKVILAFTDDVQPISFSP
jgi:hypothetical protein